ncbi:MAG: cobalt-precorrin 5A hydrolase [Oscillospiraceae bacterium]|nr:cobalt-precorrin 5A hydrolase [Oscillospiraceae bacterium]
MTASLFAYSKKGVETAKRIAACLEGETELFTAERLAGDGVRPIPKPSRDFFAGRFGSCDALVFVCSCGIAVRSVAPFVRSKTEDPAVLAVDELGRFVIPLLSGHIGGANALAERIARAIGAVPVVTTATDSNGRFSADEWAAQNGYYLSDMDAAKAVSAAILEGDVSVASDFPVAGDLPSGLTYGDGPLGVYVTFTTGAPFGTTLRLVPPCVQLGIGCRKGISKEAIGAAVETVLSENGVDPHAVRSVASIDLKSGEQGLLDYCREAGLPVSFYSSAELNAVRETVSSSEFVKSVTGVDCVCERAALTGADRLIVKKTARQGVTVAAALIHTEVRFG